MIGPKPMADRRRDDVEDVRDALDKALDAKKIRASHRTPLSRRSRAGLAGLGVMQTFAFRARPSVDHGELVRLLARFQPPAHPFHRAYPPSRYASNRLRVFIDWPPNSSEG